MRNRFKEKPVTSIPIQTYASLCVPALQKQRPLQVKDRHTQHIFMLKKKKNPLDPLPPKVYTVLCFVNPAVAFG
jgi:hypothetical protein